MARAPAVPTVALANGERLPLIGFGTWRLRGKAAYRAVRTALDAGYRLIDTATMYENETDVGRALEDSGIPRQELFVTTKLHPSDAGKEQAIIEASLAALRLDHVDLWLVHWPPTDRRLVRTWEGFIAARDAGLATSIGVSNYDLGQIDRLRRETGATPQVNQIPWAPGDWHPELLAEHRSRGIVVEGYSPFKHTDLGHPTLELVARRHDVTPAQVIVRWHVQHEVVVIPKSASPERIVSNFDVLGFELSRTEMAAIDNL